MANKKLFKSRGVQRQTPRPNTINNAGGLAYSFSDKHALAQLAVTGTFHSTFYVTAEDQLKQVEQLCQKVDSEFLAKLAVYARQAGRMKDMPAYMLAVLASRGEIKLVKQIFNIVCNNSKMLLNFVQLIRSGSLGRRSFGTSIKKLIQEWLTSRKGKALYISSVGHANPSLADVVKMVHPRPKDQEQQNVFSYLLGRNYVEELLPKDLQLFEALKRGDTKAIPDLPFRSLTNCTLSVAQWKQIARKMPWDTLRQNLNNLNRKGVFEDKRFVEEVAAKLADKEEVLRSSVFPFQLLTAYRNVENMPTQITNALQDAMEVATLNIPELVGDTFVAIDVSGSMRSGAVTGAENSKTTPVEVAALIASAILRKNPNAIVVAFDSGGGYWGYGTKSVSGLYIPKLNPRDSVMTNAQKLSALGGGGTDVSLPFQFILNGRQAFDNVILISDNESWCGRGANGGACEAWVQYSMKYPKAKLVNIDLQPNLSTQVPDKGGKVMNIGGWSDVVFTIMANFFSRDPNTNFVDVIESVEI